MPRFNKGDMVVLRRPCDDFPDEPAEVLYANKYLVYVRWKGWGRGLPGSEHGLGFPERDAWAFRPGQLVRVDARHGLLAIAGAILFAIVAIAVVRWFQIGGAP